MNITKGTVSKEIIDNDAGILSRLSGSDMFDKVIDAIMTQINDNDNDSGVIQFKLNEAQLPDLDKIANALGYDFEDFNGMASFYAEQGFDEYAPKHIDLYGHDLAFVKDEPYPAVKVNVTIADNVIQSIDTKLELSKTGTPGIGHGCVEAAICLDGFCLDGYDVDESVDICDLESVATCLYQIFIDESWAPVNEDNEEKWIEDIASQVKPFIVC